MPQMGLNFNLSSQLMLDACFEQLRLLEDFERNNVLGSFLSCEVHGTEFPPSERLANFEIIKAPLLTLLSCFSGG
jgi:hypothetical protein